MMSEDYSIVRRRFLFTERALGKALDAGLDQLLRKYSLGSNTTDSAPQNAATRSLDGHGSAGTDESRI
jgi:hypothetical protein